MNFLEKIFLIIAGKAVLDNVVDYLEQSEKIKELEELQEKLEKLRKRIAKRDKRIERQRLYEEKHPPVKYEKLLPEVLAIQTEWKERCKREEELYRIELEEERNHREKEKE